MTAILWMLGGAAIGAAAVIVLYVCGFALELLNFARNLVTTCSCQSDRAFPALWADGAFVRIMVFCAIAGAVIGLVYGISLMRAAAEEERKKQEEKNAEKARRQRIRWAEDIKHRAADLSELCEKNRLADLAEKSAAYHADSVKDDILKELAMAAQLQGKVNYLAEELERDKKAVAAGFQGKDGSGR